MPRKRNGSAQQHEEQQADDDGQISFQLPVPSDVKTVAAKIINLKGKMDDLRSDLGNVYQNAEESKHIDRQMLKLALKWAGWDQAKLDSSIMHLNHYLRTLGVAAQIDSAIGDNSARAAEREPAHA